MAEEISEEQRKGIWERLERMEAPDESVAMLLLEEYKAAAESQRRSLVVLDGKAEAQIGFAGTAIALFTALGHTHYLASSWLVAAFAALILSMAANVMALWVRTRQVPNLDHYMYLPTLIAQANKAKIAVELASAWGINAAQVERFSGQKSNLVKGGAVLFLIGIALLSIAYVVN